MKPSSDNILNKDVTVKKLGWEGREFTPENSHCYMTFPSLILFEWGSARLLLLTAVPHPNPASPPKTGEKLKQKKMAKGTLSSEDSSIMAVF